MVLTENLLQGVEIKSLRDVLLKKKELSEGARSVTEHHHRPYTATGIQVHVRRKTITLSFFFSLHPATLSRFEFSSTNHGTVYSSKVMGVLLH